MEKRLNKKIELYVTQLKDDLRDKIAQLNIGNTLPEKNKVNDLIGYIYEYNRLCLTKDDFVKRKRVKNSIPNTNRCNAKRANGEQCTRRRKDGCDFCGTHYKGTPHGLIMDTESPDDNKKTVEISAEEIAGIIYYLDKYGNVYNINDIMSNKENPEIIGRYTKNGNNYMIYDS
jgi:hypothetical protein